MNIFMSDRTTAKLFLTLAIFAGLTVLLQFVFRLETLSILICLLLSYGVAGYFANAAFPDPSGEMGIRSEWSEPRTELSLALLVLGIALVHLGYFLFVDHGTVYVKNPNLNGDFPFHWGMTRYLERLQTFWPENHILYGEKLRYAFGTNWLSALALRTGLPFGLVMGVPVLFFCYVLWNQLWKWGGIWAIFSFFLSGGGWWLSTQTWFSAWGPGDQLAWKNLFLAIFETQRGFWVALPLGIFLLRLLYEMDKNPWTDAVARRRVFFILWSVLPFFHLHSFVLISVFALVFVATGRLRGEWRKVFVEGLWYLPVPLFFVLSSVSTGNVSSSLRLTGNWMSETEPILFSWGKNFGHWLILCLLLGLASAFSLRIRGRYFLEGQEKRVFLIWTALALVFAHLLLAPWAWDQSKILIWIYLGMSMGLAAVFREWGGRLLILGMGTLLFLPGTAQFVGGLPQFAGRTPLWNQSDQKSIEILVSMLPVEERVLVAPSPHHPVLATGQPIVAGYPGHIWAHGISIDGLEERLRAWALSDARVLAAFYPKSMIWGPLERRYFERERPPEESQWREVKKSGDWVLYQR